jgi:ribosomal protein L11 methylase PrmA
LALLSRPGMFEKSWYILSGLVGTQVHRFKQDLAATPLNVREVRSENFWFSLLLDREP